MISEPHTFTEEEENTNSFLQSIKKKTRAIRKKLK